MQENNGHDGRRAYDSARVVAELDASPPRGNPFPVVGIGASAGGLEAFRQLLAALPPDTGMAFVLVQHLDPGHESLLPEILSRTTRLPVISVHDGMALRPDHVYVIPPNTSMELQDGVLRLTARQAGLHLPIDIFFCSLAKVQGSRAIGVVLSGNASDGSAGVRAIKAECGITFAQDEASAPFGGMPRSAAATGAIDYVLSPTEIGIQLGALAHHPFLIPSRPGDPGSETLPDGDRELRRIFDMLHGATRVDFSGYKPTTMRRRIGRRMMMLRAGTMAEYERYVQQHPAELFELYRDLLITVTSFFRDPDTFEALSRLLVGALTQRAELTQPVRVWVPGCATGEEVYSLAICLCELLEAQQMTVPFHLFGTDISEIALERARRGAYSAIIEDNVSPERLRRFFVKTENGYQISKAIREVCVFARHDVAKDPPFSNLDLVSCRNLLIYLDQAVQRRVLPVFHYALRPTGLLMLGSAETTAAAGDLFIPLDKQHRIYSRTAGPARVPIGLRLEPPRAELSIPPGSPAPPIGVDVQRKLERIISSRYSPDAVLVNKDLQILQFRGRAGSYLDPVPGEARPNILRMAKESLVLPLRRALQTASDTNAMTRETGVPLEIGGTQEEITIEVTPIPEASRGELFYLVVFSREAHPQTPPGPVIDGSLPADEQVARLQRELLELREYLRKLKEEYEAYSEELRAANEEVRSANEELQSTNEELGTTREELQSANEELMTVNEELQSRNQELNATNGDLRNLLSSVTVPIVMVDSELRVRRFNTGAAKLLDLAPVDIGRPVAHVRGRIETPRLEQQVKVVIETLNSLNEDLQDNEGRWYSLTIRPYRTLDDHITGAVVTFQDIDPLKRGLQAAETARDYAEAIIETVREPLVVVDSDLRVQRATTAFYDTFLVSREETEGRFLHHLGNGQWNQPRLRELIGAALFRSQPFHEFEVEHEFPNIGRRTMRLNGRRIPLSDSPQRSLLLSIEDVTERREIAEIRFQRFFESAKDGHVLVDAERLAVQDVNPFFLHLTGYSREELVGRPLAEIARSMGIPELANVKAGRDCETIRYDDLRLTRRDGGQIGVEVVGNLYEVGSQPVFQFNFRDISARQRALTALQESEQRFRLFVESVRDYALFQLDCDGVILTWNSGAQRLFGWREDEAVGRHSSLIFTAEDIANGEPERELEAACNNGRANTEGWYVRKDGNCFFGSGVLTQLCDDQQNLVGFAKVMRDMTSTREHEEQLRRSIEEKSGLVREIHHRVKNNLQVIVSLLSLQASHTSHPELVAAFEETEGRLRAIAHIHERLYASDDLSEVEFASYLTNLVRELVTLHSSRADSIDLELHAQDMVVQIEQAIPLGLILNELVLNSLKHGLKGGPGRLRVELAYTDGSFRPEMGETADDGWAYARVADSGPGLPAGLDVSRVPSMGFRIIHLLVRQLRGRLEVGQGPGADIAVHFPLKNR